RRAEAANGLPADIDVAAIAARLDGRRREPLHVVVARDAQEAAETTARLLRARSFVVGGSGDLAATDLMRRVNRLVGVVEGPARLRDPSTRLAAALEGVPTAPGPAPAPVVPSASSDWARARAMASAQDLREAGYAVHGNPDELVPADHEHHPGAGSGTVDRTRTLELAVAACLRAWRLQGGRT
ncbi:MAG: hypothetical protein ABWY19_05330, partial [Marmoricola sp.]